MYNVFDDELLSHDWCEIVFEGRNRDYGAYHIRSTAGRRYLRALYVVIALGALPFLVHLVFWAMGYAAESGTFDGDMPMMALEQLQAEEGFEYKYIPTSRKPQPQEAAETEVITVPEIVDSVVAKVLAGEDSETDEEGAVEAVQALAQVRTDSMEFTVEREDLPVDDEPVYIPITEVPEMPQFPGGEKELMRFLDEQIAYTSRHTARHITGDAEVAFIVTREGHVKDIRLLKKVHPELDRAIISAVGKLPQWTPGRVGGKPSDVSMRIPLRFVEK